MSTREEMIRDAARVIRDHVLEVSIQNWSPTSEAEAVLAVIEPMIREQIAIELIELQHAQCGYGTREGDGRTCDCKFGGLVSAGEVTGCAEYRTAARVARGGAA